MYVPFIMSSDLAIFLYVSLFDICFDNKAGDAKVELQVIINKSNRAHVK